MFDWFAARAPRPEEPATDRPSIPLTSYEREAFAALSRELGRRPRRTDGWLARLRTLPALPYGVVLALSGAVWCVAWLGVSVALSFLGVLLQGAGIALVIESRRVSQQRVGSVAPLAAAPPRPPAQRRRGR